VSAIVKGIATHNWILVKQLTRAVPVFCPLHLLDLAVFSIYHQDQIPRECEPEFDEINLELFCSLTCDANQMEVAKSRFRQKSLFLTRDAIALPTCEYIPFIRKSFNDLENCDRSFCEKAGLDLTAFQ
jgi:hypothetical protein